MRLSESFFYTLREDLKDEESVSGNLLVKSGMFKKVGNGIYMKLPLGQKVVDNVKNIIRIGSAGALSKDLNIKDMIDAKELIHPDSILARNFLIESKNTSR